ncbi:hypothetical protein BDD14_2246 [Edaphobacter modestus]|uniref:Uncharacterized protein n=1 Tax=Edaphobacter modestus TaxID=388466 RepID=A0A4Q7YUW8_9BACT|nr:hypothetical protein BDD14_2246 [Edaphobacter modestus]
MGSNTEIVVRTAWCRMLAASMPQMQTGCAPKTLL